MNIIIYITTKLILPIIIIALLVTVYVFYAVKTRNPRVSVSGEVLNTLYRLFKPKRILNFLFKNPKRKNAPLSASKKFNKKYETSYLNLNGDELITASLDKHNNIHMIYLHGGAYVIGKNGMRSRESLIGQLIDHTQGKVTFFDYPVAPETQYEETLKAVALAYKTLVKTYPEDRFMCVGDSAGGGLALAFAQMIQDEPIKQPEKLILFSPWLDVSMTNPEIEALEDVDKLLSTKALNTASKKYVGLGDYKNPLVSPIYGNFTGLGSILMFYGTHEVLYADALKLKEMSDKNGYNIQFNFYTEMQHVWLMVPISETKRALQETYDFILKP